MRKSVLFVVMAIATCPFQAFASYYEMPEYSATSTMESDSTPVYRESSSSAEVQNASYQEVHYASYQQQDYSQQQDYYQQQEPAYYSRAKKVYAHRERHQRSSYSSYKARLPQTMETGGEKIILVDPNKHVWGAYSADGNLVRAGLATAGSKWCRDLGRPCRTKAGTFRIESLGDSSCISRKFPLGEGGAPMPYCMYFNGAQALHGSYELAEANLSHGCVRIEPSEAKWIRFNFARIGTKVIVRAY